MKPHAIGYLVFFFLFIQGCDAESINERLENQTSQKHLNPYYDQAFEWREQGALDSAFYYFYLAKERFWDFGDTIGVGKCMINVAQIMIYQNDFYGAQEVSLEAISHFDSNDTTLHHYIATNFNNIGHASLQLKEYEDALRFFDQAVLLATDSVETRIYLNNIAKTYQEMGRYQDALTIYDEILDQVVGHPVEYARVLTNRAVTASRIGHLAGDVRRDLWKSLAIRTEEKDYWGLNSSYFRLSEYYQKVNLDSAYYYARKMYQVAQHLQSADDRLYALERLIQSGPASRARTHFGEYHALEDSIRLVRESAKNQFAVIRYEVEKNKAEAFRLQQENERKNFQLWMLRVVMLMVIISAVLVLALFYSWYRKRRQRLQLEAENRIQTHQLQTSKKIHDVVANGLYRVMNEIEYIPEINRDELLDKLETMYEKSRDISHEVDRPVSQVTGFHEELKALIGSFSSPDIQIMVAGNDDLLWQDISAKIKEEIKVVLQELLVNMKKHSKANTVVFKFAQIDQSLRIEYTDNGIGFPDPLIRGQGLQNTENRIVGLGGRINFVQTKRKGADLQLFIPLS